MFELLDWANQGRVVIRAALNKESGFYPTMSSGASQFLATGLGIRAVLPHPGPLPLGAGDRPPAWRACVPLRVGGCVQFCPHRTEMLPLPAGEGEVQPAVGRVWRIRISEAARTRYERTSGPPLPAGEGRGEGERLRKPAAVA